jgi:hypothetical protein
MRSSSASSFLKAAGWHPQAIPGDLAERLGRTALHAEEHWSAHHAFVSDGADLDGGAVLHLDDQRHDTADGKKT